MTIAAQTSLPQPELRCEPASVAFAAVEAIPAEAASWELALRALPFICDRSFDVARETVAWSPATADEIGRAATADGETIRTECRRRVDGMVVAYAVSACRSIDADRSAVAPEPRSRPTSVWTITELEIREAAARRPHELRGDPERPLIVPWALVIEHVLRRARPRSSCVVHATYGQPFRPGMVMRFHQGVTSPEAWWISAVGRTECWAEIRLHCLGSDGVAAGAQRAGTDRCRNDQGDNSK